MIPSVMRSLVPSLRAILSSFSKTPFSVSSPKRINGSENIGWYGNGSLNIKVSVWWDFENCQIPATVNAYHIAPLIQAALRTSGVKGPVTINAYGDAGQLSRHAQEVIAATGIRLTHVPRGGKDSADRALLVDLLFWTSENPPPAHLFLISGDGDFSNILHRLRMKNYNILLAKKDISTALNNTASIVWQWNMLVTGRGLQGKQLNRPPDATSGSRSGQPVGPVEDAYEDVEFKTSNDAIPEISKGSETEFYHELDLKPGQIPQAVLKQITDILKSYPQGLNIRKLQRQIAANCRGINKDYFGHRKFLHFLQAMPNTLKLSRHGSANGYITYRVHPVSTRISKTKTRSSQIEPADRHEENDKSYEQVETNRKSSSSPHGSISESDVTEKGSTLSELVKETCTTASAGLSNNVVDQRCKQQKGFIGRFLGKWFGSGLNDSGENVHDSKDEDIKAKKREANEGNAKNEGAVADGMKLNGLTHVLKTSGVKGPVTINAYRDVIQLSCHSQKAIAATGIGFTHVPRDLKPGQIPQAVLKQIADILKLYPQGLDSNQLLAKIPTNYRGINRDYFGHRNFLHFLQAMPNILKLSRHASPSGHYTYLVHPVSTRISKTETRSSQIEPADRHGENDKSYEQVETNRKSSSSPHGSILKSHVTEKGSTLSEQVKEKSTTASGGLSNDDVDQSSGQPIGPFEDAYEDVEFETSNDAMFEISEGSETEFYHELDLKPCQIPQAVLKQIADILKSYPQGLSINQLQSRIVRNYMGIMNKDYFGHMTFLQFLQAMPNTLKLSRHVSADGYFTYFVHPVFTRISKTKTRSSQTEPAERHGESDKSYEQVETNTKSSSSPHGSISKSHVTEKGSTLSEKVKETRTTATGGLSKYFKAKPSCFS